MTDETTTKNRPNWVTTKLNKYIFIFIKRETNRAISGRLEFIIIRFYCKRYLILAKSQSNSKKKYNKTFFYYSIIEIGDEMAITKKINFEKKKKKVS